jgi:cell division septal protein FtsQ
MSWIAAVLFITGLAVIAGFYMEHNTRINAVEFSGSYFTEVSDLSEQIEPISPVGELADSVNYGSLIDALHTLPYVKNIDVSMNFRGRLTFTVHEHDPVGLIVDGSDRMYVSDQGILLPIVHGKAKDVPLVYGFRTAAPGDSISTPEWEQMEQFLTEAKQRPVCWSTLSELAWNDAEGVVALSHENGVKLIFGREEYSERLEHWELFYTDVITYEGIEKFRSIDLRFRNQIVTQQI